MEISPASLDQLQQARSGKWTLIPAAHGGVARDLKDIDPSIRLRQSDENGIFVVYQVDESGDEEMVTTATSCDQRLVERIRKLRHSSYDFVKELDRLDDQYERDQDHARREHNGEMGERLLHGLQTDLGVQNTVYLADKVGDRAKRKGLK